MPALMNFSYQIDSLLFFQYGLTSLRRLKQGG
ncbi:hypothetical protein EMIT0373P_40583 [Pseudomonas chlororaphis]